MFLDKGRITPIFATFSLHSLVLRTTFIRFTHQDYIIRIYSLRPTSATLTLAE